MQGSRVLITGGAGFIGSHLADRLMKENFEVSILDNLSAGKTENIQAHLKNKNFRLINGDVCQRSDVKKVVVDVDVVFHLAALVNVPLSIENPLLVNDVNVGGTLNLLEASAKANVERFVYASTCAVYGEACYLPIDEKHPISPLSPYGISKLAAEHYCKIFHIIHGLRTVCLRFFNVYGPRQFEGPYSGVITQFINKLKEKKPPIIYGDGAQTRDFLYVEDAVEACLLALRSQQCAGEVINIGTGKQTTINELASVLAKLLEKGNIKPVYQQPRKGDILRSCANIEKAEKLLEYNPRFSFKNGLKKMLQIGE